MKPYRVVMMGRSHLEQHGIIFDSDKFSASKWWANQNIVPLTAFLAFTNMPNTEDVIDLVIPKRFRIGRYDMYVEVDG